MTISSNVLMTSLVSCILFSSQPVFYINSSQVVKIDDRNPHHISVTQQDQSPSFTSSIERLFNNIQNDIVSTAEAMPEDKFNFTPESLHLKNSALKGVRTFAGQIKHLATDNFAIWSPLTGDSLPPDITDVNGPEKIKSKAEIIKYLKDSFALGSRAISTMTEKNAMEMIDFRGRKLPRLDLAFYALTHANEHYGQMAVYLRMCGVVPPATIREKSY